MTRTQKSDAPAAQQGGDGAAAHPCELSRAAPTGALDARPAREHEAERCASNRLRDEVMAIVLDDLKAPLFALSCSASQLARMGAARVGTERFGRCVADIGEALSLCHVVVSRLAAVERIEECDGLMDVRPRQAARLIDTALRVARPVAAWRDVRVVTHVRNRADSLPCDDVWMIQALAALLLLAIRRTPHGGRVSVVASHTGLAMRVAVHDEGPVLSPEEAARLFAPPAVEDYVAPPRGFHARRVIELHRGAREARPGDPAGMVFEAVLPL